MATPEQARHNLRYAKRIIVKVGTAIVTNEDGTVAIGRMGSIVEQICRLVLQGKEVILVSSGAVGLGTRRLNQQALLSTPLRHHINPASSISAGDMRAFAAAGQAGLMLLYEIMFKNYDVACAQVLVTDDDFLNNIARDNFRSTLNNLLSHGTVPVVNENDVVSLRSTPLRDENNKIFWDNDSLATLVGIEMGVDLILLLTDVEGLFLSNPNDLPVGETPELVDVFHESLAVSFAGKSRVGRGGMQAKVEAAQNAVKTTVKAVVIASGQVPLVVQRVVGGERIGTLFVRNPPAPPTVLESGEIASIRALPVLARRASSALHSLTTAERTTILLAVAEALEKHVDEILEANKQDLHNFDTSASNAKAEDANKAGNTLRARLGFSKEKLNVVCEGIRQIAHSSEVVGDVVAHTELSTDLILKQITAPIGVILVIFESRPDVLPQIAALTLKTCNGLIVKGGKEAHHTNTVLHKIITTAVHEASQSRVSKHIIGLANSRADVNSLLSLNKEIDLVVPRGSSQLVSTIQASTKIPVLGHADGICHVYVDKHANVDKALNVCLDAKCDYPSACNAAETFLFHKECLHIFDSLSSHLLQRGVKIFAGPQLKQVRPNMTSCPSLSHEYSDLQVTVELVESVDKAIDHINRYSSSHTDAIVTEDKQTADKFLQQVDSACVFHNASTRFADGYRFGLGAEVGISTSRIHARGPVGVRGLLTTKYVLVSSSAEGDVAADFSNGKKSFTHRALNSKL